MLDPEPLPHVHEIAPPTTNPVVIVADDDQALRSLFRTALERAGFTVLLELGSIGSK